MLSFLNHKKNSKGSKTKASSNSSSPMKSKKKNSSGDNSTSTNSTASISLVSVSSDVSVSSGSDQQRTQPPVEVKTTSLMSAFLARPARLHLRQRACSVPTFTTASSAAAACEQESTTNATFSGKNSPPARHARCVTMCDHDFTGLISRSRGFVYDPSTQPSMPHHRERDYNHALAGSDFERFIFRPKEGEEAPRGVDTAQLLERMSNL